MTEQIESYIETKNDNEIDFNNISKIENKDNNSKKSKTRNVHFAGQKNITSSLDQSNNNSPFLLKKCSKQDLPIKILEQDKDNISVSSISVRSKQFPTIRNSKIQKKTVLEERKMLKSLLLRPAKKNYLRSNTTSVPHKKLSNAMINQTSTNPEIFMTSKNINFNKFNNRSTNNNKDNRKYTFKKQVSINKNLVPEIVDPLSIPEEDKIFSEMNQYCNTEHKDNGNNSYFNFSKENSKELTLTNKSEISKKMSKTFYGTKKTKLNLPRQILNSLYMTDGDYYDELNKIKKSKNKIDLEGYQDSLLNFIQPSISTYGYRQLKKKLHSIKKTANVTINNYREQIKNIEDDEEKIINNINYYYDNYMNSKYRLTDYYSKHSLKYLDVQLPSIKFIRVVRNKIIEKIQMQMQKIKLKIKNKIYMYL